MRKIFPVCCASTATAASNAPASRIDASAVFLNSFISGVIYHTDGSKETVIYEHHFSVAVWECSSVVSDENKGRHTCRYRGDGDEGSTLGATFFAYKTKRQLCISRGFLI